LPFAFSEVKYRIKRGYFVRSSVTKASTKAADNFIRTLYSDVVTIILVA